MHPATVLRGQATGLDNPQAARLLPHPVIRTRPGEAGRAARERPREFQDLFLELGPLLIRKIPERYVPECYIPEGMATT